MFKQEGVLYRDVRFESYHYYSAKRDRYISFGFAKDTKSMMRDSNNVDSQSWYVNKPENIEQYLVPLTFAQQAAIITDGCL